MNIQPKSQPKRRRKHPICPNQNSKRTPLILIFLKLNNQDLEEDGNITTDKMKNVVRLIKDIDSLGKNNVEKVEAFSKNITNRMGAFPVAVKKR